MTIEAFIAQVRTAAEDLRAAAWEAGRDGKGQYLDSVYGKLDRVLLAAAACWGASRAPSPPETPAPAPSRGSGDDALAQIAAMDPEEIARKLREAPPPRPDPEVDRLRQQFIDGQHARANPLDFIGDAPSPTSTDPGAEVKS